MSKKSKAPVTSTKSARKTEAPMRVTRANDEKVAAPVPVATVVAAPAPVAKPVTVAVPPLATKPVAAKPAATELVLDRAQVARLAFAKFAARGYTHGHSVEDWFAAEAELRARN